MNRLKVATRINLITVLLSLLLLGIGALGLWGIKSSNDSLRTVYDDRVVPMQQLTQIQKLQMDASMALLNAIGDPRAEEIAQAQTTVADAEQAIDKIWAAYMATYLTPEEAVLARDFAARKKRLAAEGLRPTLQAVQSQKIDVARNLADDVMRPLQEQVDTAMTALIKLQMDVAKAEYDAATARYGWMFALAIGAVLAGTAGALVLGTVVARGLSRELGAEPSEAAAVARAVASGDLAVAITLRSGDRTSMMASLLHMRDSLQQAVRSVRQNADSVATASAEIAQGNLDLSQRTEEQASALQQTAASMEELATTVQRNADASRQASQLAASATDTAVRGGQVVGEVVSTMKSIEDSSRQIAEIIAVIDSIAFQTNILALNAAVEAARAGEQGRGFAVVAGEVRALSQRSAQAARDVKTLIGTSSERVATGAGLVAAAGSTMAEVVESIRRVNDLVAEISAASIEQSAGVAQIETAVTQMDQVTQQNAALVEESAAAAESLRHQAHQLQETVSVFRTGDESLAPVTAAAVATSAAKPAFVPGSPDGTERRGPNRARNVVRPGFSAGGAARPAAKGTDEGAVLARAMRTGTDDAWESF